MTAYAEFLQGKKRRVEQAGRYVDLTAIHPMLHPWQAELVQWAVGASRAALWADTGMGKTVMQVEWARLSGDTALIVAPLAVCQQTVREAAKVGVSATYVRSGAEIEGPGVWVTNYEMVPHFDADKLDAVALDESSILKQSDGKTRSMLIEHFRAVPHRLACSATPAPNDPEELTNQAEFLGRMSRAHMLAAYFIHDADGWRLKGHAKAPMMRWMAQWAVALTRPSDVGGDDTGYDLPGLKIVPHLLAVDVVPDDQLFATEIGGVSGRAEVRRKTLNARVAEAARLVAHEPDEPWLLWCGLNAEADLLAAMIPDAVNVHGGLSPEEKSQHLLDFADGKIRRIITKPSIASLGLNWQHCHKMAFVGLGDSYEQYYQAIRRCYRYGQTRVVEAHVILSELESQIAANISRKERQAGDITAALVAEMRRARTQFEVAV
ncbi:DEAD/DEAH box helicase [Nocardia sp. NBC_00565]|uniref:DEAD/DEAH box helicase n=1 Tax=Nocardia sp. NBC_00565 TaxID=2975993 RepID=UPI002E81D6DD|nr:DEAD/DEAH box helicase [Nocardia sp. NBC_00565]WUC03668.1 DEAD/DEAH box helicase [Nocardia sp. NBC_00565]